MFNADASKNRYIYACYFLLICVLFINTIKENSLKFCGQLTSLLLLLIFSFVSSLWSVDMNLTLTMVRTLGILLMLTCLLYNWNSRNLQPLVFIKAIMIGGTAEALYFIYLYGINTVLDAIINEVRIGLLVNNQNAIGNSLSCSMIAIVGYAICYKKYLSLFLLIPNLLVFFATNSRTAFITFGVGCVIICYYKLMTDKRLNLSQRFWKAILFVISIVIIWRIIKILPFLSGTINHFQEGILELIGGDTNASSVETRMDYISLGWAQFLKSSFWGNGFGCAGYALLEKYGYFVYLHNNFIEMLASTGLIGFCLFYSAYFSSIRKHLLIVKEGNPAVIISLALLCSELISHMGCVNYYSKITYIMFALWFSVANGRYGEQ